MKPCVLVLGGILLIAGLFTGLNDLHITADGGQINCGGAFDDPSHGGAARVDYDNQMKSMFIPYIEKTHYVDLCGAKQDTYQILAGVAGVLGLGLLLGGAFIPGRKQDVGSA